ncbi:MAG TPA: hypothetical protein VIL49_08915, partial [Capillimicrobium sp.]
MARRWALGSTTLAALAIVPASAAAAPLIAVDQLRLERLDDRVEATARVAWSADGARDLGMTAGDLRLVAVSDGRR